MSIFDSELFAGYSDEPMPLQAYCSLASVFTGGFGAGLLGAAKRGRLPDDVSLKDVVVFGLATHKIARLLTKDAVTSFLRAPFVRLEEMSGNNSLQETARGSGLQKSLGQLLSCPECTGHWVAGGLVLGALHAPGATRAVCLMYSSLAIGDALQFVYVGLKTRA